MNKDTKSLNKLAEYTQTATVQAASTLKQMAMILAILQMTEHGLQQLGVTKIDGKPLDKWFVSRHKKHLDGMMKMLAKESSSFNTRALKAALKEIDALYSSQ